MFEINKPTGVLNRGFTINRAQGVTFGITDVASRAIKK